MTVEASFMIKKSYVIPEKSGIQVRIFLKTLFKLNLSEPDKQFIFFYIADLAT